jgi:uncharacterized membrane protein
VSGTEESSSRGPILGAGAVVLAALCCFVGPAILGAVAGAAIGSTLGVLAAIVCAALVAVPVALSLRSRQDKGAPGC